MHIFGFTLTAVAKRGVERFCQLPSLRLEVPLRPRVDADILASALSADHNNLSRFDCFSCLRHRLLLNVFPLAPTE
jgi:hypothetical protein